MGEMVKKWHKNTRKAFIYRTFRVMEIGGLEPVILTAKGIDIIES